MSMLAHLVSGLLATPVYEPRSNHGTEVMREHGDVNRRAVLSAIADSATPIGATQIAARTLLTRRTVSAHLHTLANAGLIARSSNSFRAPWVATANQRQPLIEHES